jgi:dTDP-4-dehydrorhamnose reductase
LKAVLVGATGQLGSELRRSVPADVVLDALSSEHLDVGDPEQVSRELSRRSPGLILNASGYTQVDQAESEAGVAFRINAEGPRLLAQSASACGARLIHISTDFVFAGDSPVPYDAEATPAPLSVYGRSKLAGEQAVLKELGSRATVVRTSWVYARTGRNFVNTILTSVGTRESLNVVFDQAGSPTWARSLARAVWAIAGDPRVHGIQHWSDAGVASWYDFAVAIQDEALARGLLPRRVPIHAIRTADYPTPARRPAYSVLDCRRTAAALGFEPPHWRESLRAMFDEPAAK